MDYMGHKDYKDYNRLFNPYAVPYHSNIAHFVPGSLIKYNETKQFNQLQGSISADRLTPRLAKESLVVYVGAARRGDGSSNNNRAAYGIYFGPESKYNMAGLVDLSQGQGLSGAMVEGLAKAVDIVNGITEKDISVTSVKYATDSDYLMDHIAYHDDDEGEDDEDDEDREAPHPKLEAIRKMLDHMEYSDEGGIGSALWLVSDEENSKARDLAKSILEFEKRAERRP